MCGDFYTAVFSQEKFFNDYSVNAVLLNNIMLCRRMPELLILTSPPASGKTFWIQSFANVMSDPVLVISPLRALADECKKNWGEKIIVMTPEEWMNKKVTAKVVVFDEFHLLSYWGNTFRPLMWEVFESLSVTSQLVVGLTATLSRELQKEIQFIDSGFERILWVDHGNQTLKWKPSSYVQLTKRFMEKCIFSLRTEGTSLIFCQYREEVSLWEKRLKEHGFSVWSCRGGEAGEFSLRVAKESPPQFIVSTTVLSHGVNLPSIRRVFFFYPLRNKDFWIQMTARGGRRGEDFQVFALEPPFGLRWSRTGNLLATGKISVKIFFSNLTNQLEQCFLKG